MIAYGIRSMSQLIRIGVRVYGIGEQVTLSHGFIVDDVPAGMSSIIGTVTIDSRSTTIKSLRQSLEYDSRDYVKRRSLLFQEALFIMERLPNIYNRPKHLIGCYKLGYAIKNTNEVRLLDTSNEDELLHNLIKRLHEVDLIIIPVTQLPDE